MVEEVVTVPVSAAPVVEAAPTVVAPVETIVAPAVETIPTVIAEQKPAAETAPLLQAQETIETNPKDTVVDAAKVDDQKPTAEPIALPVYEFKLPEGAQTDNPVFKSFNEKLGEFQNFSKTDQAAVQKFGQEMIDMHLADVKNIVENQNKSAWDWFNNRNKEWLDSSKNDPVIGGENFPTTISDATRAISLYGGTKAQQIEVAKFMKDTGIENSPTMLRFLSNITKVAAKEGSPVSSRVAPIQKQGIAEAMYGSKKVA